MRRIWLWIGLAVAVIAILVAVNSFRGRLGWTAVVQTPADLAQQIAPGFIWVVPEGEGPFPAAMLLSGCDGPQSNLNRLAAELAAAGWLSVIVDSHGPRGLDDAQLWRLVCAGQILNGAERASDIAVALAELPLQIRGFGPVKEANERKAAKRREELLAAFRDGGSGLARAAE